MISERRKQSVYLYHLFLIVILIVLSSSCNQKKETALPILSENRVNWTSFRGNPQLTGYIDEKTGENFSIHRIFSFEDTMISAPVIVDEVLYVISESGTLYSFSLENRSLIWKKTLDDGFESSLLYQDGFLYFGSLSGIFYKLDSADGAIVWKNDIGTRISGSANLLPAEKNQVFFGCYDSFFYSLNMESGKITGSVQVKSYINGTPAARNNLLAFGSCDGNLYLINGRDMKKENTLEFGNYVAGSPVFHQEQVTAAAYNGVIKSFNVVSGSCLWEWTAPSGDGFVASPATDGKILVIGNKDGTLYALDTSLGSLLWEFVTGGPVESSALIVGDKVMAGSTDGYFYILNLKNGTEIISFALDGIPYASAAWYKGLVYIITDKGILYSIGG